jgi:hypothetical protein
MDGQEVGVDGYVKSTQSTPCMNFFFHSSSASSSVDLEWQMALPLNSNKHSAAFETTSSAWF